MKATLPVLSHFSYRGQDLMKNILAVKEHIRFFKSRSLFRNRPRARYGLPPPPGGVL